MGSLTNGERLIIRRRRDGESQREAAAWFGVSLYMYRRWELDRENPPKIQIGRLEKHEICFLHRHRDGVAVKDLAIRLGITAWWVTQMERGQVPATKLMEFWQGSAA